MVSRELVVALAAARRRIPADTWQQVAAQLTGWNAYPTSASIPLATSALLNRDAAWILSSAFEMSADARWGEIAAAMIAVDTLVGDDSRSTEVIWTGPANTRFPVRRIDQVLYDLVSQARRRIILITFAAHRIRHLCVLLTKAVKRGVALTLIVESEDESEGQLTRDALAALQNVPLASTRICYWPSGKRKRNQAGRPGKLHIKCAIVDDVAVVGSANLTDDAFNRNMELGILIREKVTVTAIAEHFRELISRGILVELPQPNQPW
jgi:phosphatidylserine/phosphatidylglycerophosphate/cardiolipin synthase-like enzyme